MLNQIGVIHLLPAADKSEKYHDKNSKQIFHIKKISMNVKWQRDYRLRIIHKEAAKERGQCQQLTEKPPY